ncbi:hypothetical protein [Clostridium botulinum]|uniref:hypothetical protein n=1 Tax=Clostridium botulinum TaxID=1491 RepID=UPI0013FF64AA|nr:hypothetical protein [Clostridium botulinum]MBY6915472.1 hypothetical protein [Clostridium botulinum]NFQ38311.1 hypothetical protein [Clostridium botulinum]
MKSEEKINNKITVLANIISKVSYISNTDARGLITEFSKYIAFDDIKKCYLRYGYKGLINLKNIVEHSEKRSN